jgi:competence protein ComEA
MAHRPNRWMAALLLAFTLATAARSFAAEEHQKVNLNSASAQELTALRGIGEKTAQAIVAYRESHGPFKSVEELVEVKGIGEKLMTSLRDQVTVGTASANANAPAPKAKPGS